MWDKTAAVTTLNCNARARSLGRCAEYVRNAIESGGITLARHLSAKDYGSSLEVAGFLALPQGDPHIPQVADVVVIQSIPGHLHGHMAMYNGTIWVSDFRQLHGFYPGPGYRSARPSHTFYRYPQ